MADELIFGKYKSMEEAEAAFKENEENAQKLADAQAEIEELKKVPPKEPPKKEPPKAEEETLTEEEIKVFDPDVLTVMEKRDRIRDKKLTKDIVAGIRQEQAIEKLRSDTEDWIIESFSSEDNPEMDIRNEKGKLFLAAQKLWKEQYGEHPLYQKVAVLEAFHQLSGEMQPPPKKEEKKVVNQFVPGSQYQVGPKGGEMPWEEFIKLPKWRQDEILAQEAQDRVDTMLGKK